VTDRAVQNLTRAGETFDSLDVTVTTRREPSQVLAAIQKALAECGDLGADQGVAIKELTHRGETKVVRYQFWWFVKDYEGRDRTRDEVFSRVSGSLAAEDLQGTEITLA
jgi:hypothetical protein